MKTQGDKAYKLFHKSISIMTKQYKLNYKGVNNENLHAVFTDSYNDNYCYTYAIKVVLNEQTKEVETYLAIANPYAHQSLNKFNSITKLKEILNHAMKLKRLAQESTKATRFVSDVEE